MYLGVLIPLFMCGRRRATLWSQCSPSVRGLQGQNPCWPACVANVSPQAILPGQENYILLKSIRTHWTSEAKALCYSEAYEKSPGSLTKSNIGSLLWKTLQRKGLEGQFIWF